jgi:indoleamine 2,3-dioxygenase
MSASLDALPSYDIDPHTGFMPSWEPLERFHAGFEPWDELAPLVGHLIRNRRIRERIGALPLLDWRALHGRAERERALTLLCVFANACVWGGPEPALRLPATLAVPLCGLCGEMGRQPIVHYAGMQLYNWRRIDKTRPLSADNAELLVQFLGGVDETWFYVANFDLELLAAPLLVAAHGAVGAAAREDMDELTRHLATIAEGMPGINAALERQREWTDPHVFFHRVRPFVQGWPAPGVVYEGVSDEPRALIGGSAGQSSVMQALDAVLGIEHARPQTGAYLRLLRSYMPPAHRRFVDDCERLSRVRSFVARSTEGADAALRDAYNAAVAGVTQFRTLHVRLAHDYIAKPSGLNPDVKGTGGTSFVDFLRDTRRETIDAQLRP